MSGRLNLYACQKCGGRIVTIDLVEGTTPFMLGCRASEHDAKILAADDYFTFDDMARAMSLVKCQGDMHSSFYRVPPGSPAPSWEWYRPTLEEYKRLSMALREYHVDKGGLLIRPIKDEGRKIAAELAK